MRWDWNYEGFGELLCGPEMEALMSGLIDKAGAAAEAIAPEWTGTYKRSFETEHGVKETLSGRRAYGTLRNTAPYAASVEYGNATFKAHHVLGRAIDHMRE